MTFCIVIDLWYKNIVWVSTIIHFSLELNVQFGLKNNYLIIENESSVCFEKMTKYE